MNEVKECTGEGRWTTAYVLICLPSRELLQFCIWILPAKSRNTCTIWQCVCDMYMCVYVCVVL